MPENPAVRPSPIPWPPILLGLVLVGGWLLGEITPLSWPGLNDLPARIIGLSIGIAGLALTIWAAATLRTHNCHSSPQARQHPRHERAIRLSSQSPLSG